MAREETKREIIEVPRNRAERRAAVRLARTGKPLEHVRDPQNRKRRDAVKR